LIFSSNLRKEFFNRIDPNATLVTVRFAASNCRWWPIIYISQPSARAGLEQALKSDATFSGSEEAKRDPGRTEPLTTTVADNTSELP
jgi:hypothetical protein